MVKYYGSLSVAADGTAFEGKHADWRVQTITGRVAARNDQAQATAYASRYTAMANVTHSTTLLLVDEYRRQHSVYLPGSADDIFIGQVVTACYGVSSGRSYLFAVLNHSARRATVITQNLNEINGPRGCLGAVVTVYLFISSGVIIYLLLRSSLREQTARELANGGLDPLWQITRQAAQRLSASA